MDRLIFREADDLVLVLQSDVDEIVNELRGIEKDSIEVPAGWRWGKLEWERVINNFREVSTSNYKFSVDKDGRLYAFYYGKSVDLGNVMDYYRRQNMLATINV